MTTATVESRLQALEARVQELEDDRAIREVLARYAFLADTKQDQAWVNLFTEDGVMDLGPNAGYVEYARWQGHKELLAFISDTDATKTKVGQGSNSGSNGGGDSRMQAEDRMKRKSEGRIMHGQGNNLRTFIDGDRALAESYSIVMTVRDGATNVSPGSNRWTFQRVNGEWKIKERYRRALGSEEYLKVLLTKS